MLCIVGKKTKDNMKVYAMIDKQIALKPEDKRSHDRRYSNRVFQ